MFEVPLSVATLEVVVAVETKVRFPADPNIDAVPDKLATPITCTGLLKVTVAFLLWL